MSFIQSIEYEGLIRHRISKVTETMLVYHPLPQSTPSCQRRGGGYVHLHGLCLLVEAYYISVKKGNRGIDTFYSVVYEHHCLIM